MVDHPDRDLVEQARSGHAPALAELFTRYWRAARAAAFGVTGDLASAEDAASEAFRQALFGMDSLRHPDRFGPWLRTIVIRKARLELQRRHPAVDPIVDTLSDPQERPDDALERMQLGALIHQAARQLPEALREVIALTSFEGYDAEAAARFLDIPAGTLRRRLHDGRKHLRATVEQILQGSKSMKEEREHQIQKFKEMIDQGDIYQALRGSLALRPPPSELVGSLIQSSVEFNREAAQRLLRPSPRATDPHHPAGSIALAIRKALPEFRDHPLEAAEAAVRFMNFTGEHRDRLRAVLPPGFAEGRPGAYLRPSRAILPAPGQSLYERLKASPDKESFGLNKPDMRISDVLDLTWMVEGPLELRSVQELLERLTSSVLPGEQVRFSPYDEPRYRSALQLHVSEVPARAALGGVLNEWPGRPPGVEAAHLRIFLEPWAKVEFDHLPDRP